MTETRHIMVAMSGGVDSSVAAGLLHEQGHRVIGVTLRLLQVETGFGCCGSTRDIEDAKAVCARLGVPHFTMDFSKTFGERVMAPFTDTYLRGETPNPCIACNRFIKFDALMEKARALGADAVATGHYARIKRREARGERREGYTLHRAAYREKDQSYVLHNLGQVQLSRLMFPIGDLSKPEVREIARGLKLKTADKPDSQEICFVPGADAAAYVKGRPEAVTAATTQAGDICDTAGKKLGRHKGVAFYTRGQRQGLGLSAGKPLYVVDLKPETNTVVVGEDVETLSPRFSVRDVHWTAGAAPAEDFRVAAQIRSRHEAAACRVRVENDGATVEWDKPQRAVTPGQAAVFYDGDEVLGRGTIANVSRSRPTPSDEQAPGLATQANRDVELAST
jgi:tRNA-uridine 2-sulfurtransferase